MRTAHYAVATANPLATQEACLVLNEGGTAADALVTAQAVLGLVEPQASGIGGGGFLVYYDAAAGSVQAYDGREVAPKAATENYLRWISDADRTEPKPDARASGRSIGVPGILRLLQDVHTEHGKTAWRDLFTPAVTMADDGFDISPRLAAAIADAAPQLKVDPNASAVLPQSRRQPEDLRNPADQPGLLKDVGRHRIRPAVVLHRRHRARHRGSGRRHLRRPHPEPDDARRPVRLHRQEARAALHPLPRQGDLRHAAASSGGIAVAATLGMLEHFPMGEHKPTDIDLNGGKPTVMGVHLISEAERLAYADRDKYVADTDFVPLPGGSPDTLLNSDYLAGRAALISEQHTMGTAKPGEFGPPTTPAPPTPEHGTSQISIVDSQGNAAAMTTTVESAFGSFHMVDGFILNNQLTDFAAEPVGPDGAPVANRLQPGSGRAARWRPRWCSTGSGQPGSKRQLYAVAGSPGGSVIIQFVVKTLVGMIDWGLDPQQAVSAVDFGAANSPKTNVGGEHPAIDTSDNGDHDPLVVGLRKLGHQVDLADQSSGLSAIVRDNAGWVGGADPRREGLSWATPGDSSYGPRRPADRVGLAGVRRLSGCGR